MTKVTIEKCCCGHAACSTYWLVGIGSFAQSSGFTKEEAERVARALNTHNSLVEALRRLRAEAGGYIEGKSDEHDKLLATIDATLTEASQ